MNRVNIFRLFVGQLPQQDSVDDGEDGGVAADAECEREHGDGRESRAVSQHAHRIADVFREGLDPGQAALDAILFPGLRYAAECAKRGGAGFVWREAALTMLSRRQLDVRSELVVEIGVVAAPAEIFEIMQVVDY